MSTLNRTNVKVPSNVEILYVPCYFSYVDKSVLQYDFSEEFSLAILIRSTSLPNLRVVAVPASPFDATGKAPDEAPDASTDLTTWKKNRKALEEMEVVKSGKVVLRKLKAGDLGE